MISYLTRVNRALYSNFKLIYFFNTKYNYTFFILGSGDFIYKVLINKNYVSCNCEDFRSQELFEQV